MRVFGIDFSDWRHRLFKLPRRSDAPSAGSRARGAPRLNQRKRRIAAAGALGIAVILLAWALVPSTAAGTAVVVAARAIAAGTELAGSDLRIVSFPEDLAPRDHVPAVDELVGKTAAHQVAAGVPVTKETVMRPGTTHLAAGHVLVPISIPDSAAAAVLAPGHHIRVYAAGADAQAAGSRVDQQVPSDSGKDNDSGKGTDSAKGKHSSKLDDMISGDSATLVPDAVVTGVRKPKSAGLAGETGTVVTLSVPEERAAGLTAVAAGGLGFALLN